MPEPCSTIDCCNQSVFANPVTPVTGEYLLTLIADPLEGGTLEGAGTYDPFSTVEITATPALPVGQDVGVDMVFVIDESSLLPESKEIMEAVAATIESALAALNIGNGDVGNRYAVVAFGHGDPAEEEIAFCDSDAFIAAVPGIGLVGGALQEDAYEGINFAITGMPWREEQFVSKVIFFISDEDRNDHIYAEGADQAAQFASLKTKLVDGEFILAAMVPSVNAVLRDENNAVPSAADYTGRTYIADGSGGYTVTAGLTDISPGDDWDVTPAFPSGMKSEYFDLALDSDVRGYFFELNAFNGFQAGGATAQSVLAIIAPALAPAIYESLVWSFVGWYDETGGLVSANATYSFSIIGNTVLYARFEFAEE